MAKFCGWAGTILNVDLTQGKIDKEPLSIDFARKYLGASGFNSAKLFKLVKPEVDALSPENVLMFGAGPLCGTLAPGSSRLTVTAKSPLTDIFGDANLGQFFASKSEVATDIVEDAYRSAIFSTIDTETGQPVTSFTLTNPTGTISVATGVISTLGPVTYP